MLMFAQLPERDMWKGLRGTWRMDGTSKCEFAQGRLGRKERILGKKLEYPNGLISFIKKK